MARLSKELLLIRLKWEIELPEMPRGIQQSLRDYYNLATSLNFETREAFNLAHEFHRELVYSTERDIARDEKLRETISYRKENWATLKPYYDLFIVKALNSTEAKIP